jgi:hypothetical protein
MRYALCYFLCNFCKNVIKCQAFFAEFLQGNVNAILRPIESGHMEGIEVRIPDGGGN